MVRMIPMAFMAVALSTLSPVGSLAEDDSSDAQAKQIAEQFLKAFKAKDVDSLMKSADVPWFNEGKKVIRDHEELKKGFQSLFEKKKGDFSDFSFEFVRVVPYKSVQGSVEEEERKLLDEVIKGDDRILLLNVHIQKKKETVVLVVRFKDGKAKVVGLKG